jgi:hypothetical protein
VNSLDVRMGHKAMISLRVKSSGVLTPARYDRNVVEGSLEFNGPVTILTGEKSIVDGVKSTSSRAWVIEPCDGADETIRVHDLWVRGSFRIVHAENESKRARALWKNYKPE